MIEPRLSRTSSCGVKSLGNKYSEDTPEYAEPLLRQSSGWLNLLASRNFQKVFAHLLLDLGTNFRMIHYLLRPPEKQGLLGNTYDMRRRDFRKGPVAKIRF